MHDVLFERLDDWNTGVDATESFVQYVGELGLDVAAFASCLASGETAPQGQSETELGRSMGVSGTPAFFVNDWFVSGAQDYSVFQQVIEAALRGESPPPTPTPLPEGVSPFDANPEQPGYAYTGDVTLGAPEAPLVLLEFIDFGSQANRDYFGQNWAVLVTEYVEAGSVRLVVKHYPAVDSMESFGAAVAAECAGQQSAFWEMHDLLFANQQEWVAAEDTDALFEAYASGLGLDVGAFISCVDDGARGEKVQEDVLIAQRNQLPPAPQFVILFGEQGSIVGQEELLNTLDEMLGE
jgi:protein-disulfide isomerase